MNQIQETAREIFIRHMSNLLLVETDTHIEVVAKRAVEAATIFYNQIEEV